MKFNRTVLAKILGEVFHATPTRTPREVYKLVLAEICDGRKRVMFTASDGEVTLSREIELLDEAPTVRSFLVSKKLVDICRESNCDEIEIQIPEAGKLSVHAGTSVFNLEGIEDADTFPLPKQNSDGDESFSIECAALAKAISRTEFACDVQSTRYALGGVYFDFSGGSLVLVSTDSRRLSIHAVGSTNNEEGDVQAVVPQRAAKALLAALPEDGSVSVSVGPTQLVFSTEDTKLFARQVEGRFPEYQRVIPDGFRDSFSVVSGPLQGVVRQSMIVTNAESKGVDFALVKGDLKLTSTGAEVGDAKVAIPVSAEESTSVEFSIDPKFLLEFLKVLDGAESVEVKFNDGNSVLMFEADGTRYGVMPLSRD